MMAKHPSMVVTTVAELQTFLGELPPSMPVDPEFGDTLVAYVREIIQDRDRRLAVSFREAGPGGDK